jgi:hypothetical protein
MAWLESLSSEIADIFDGYGPAVIEGFALKKGAGFQVAAEPGAWHKENKAYLAEYWRSYRKRNREAVNQQKREWRAANADRVNAARRASYAAKKRA